MPKQLTQFQMSGCSCCVGFRGLAADRLDGHNECPMPEELDFGASARQFRLVTVQRLESCLAELLSSR